MKNKKWLLIIVIIVFVLNIGIWSLTKFAKIDRLVQSKASEFLAKTLNAQVEIGFFTFNDKQANVSNIKITQNQGLYDLSIEQIYVEYNLTKLIVTRFRNLRAIKNITILDPKLILNLPVPASDQESKPIQIPVIEDFFQNLKLENGEFTLNYNDKYLNLSNSWDSLDVSIKNTAKSQINLSAVCKDSHLSASSTLDDGKIISAQLSLLDFFPKLLKLPYIDSLTSNINLNADYTLDNGIQYNGSLNTNQVESFQRVASSPLISFRGNPDKTFVESQILVEGNTGRFQAVLSDLLKPNRSIQSDLFFETIDPSSYLQDIKGEIQAHANVSGSLIKPKIEVEASSNSLDIYGQQVDKIQAEALIGFEQIDFSVNNLEWEDNKILGGGVFNYKTGLTAAISSDNFSYDYTGIEMSGKLSADFSADINLTNDLSAQLKLADLRIAQAEFSLDNLNFQANLQDSQLSALLTRPTKDINLSIKSDIKADSVFAELNLKKFDLNRYFQKFDLPQISGNLEINKNFENIDLNSKFRVFDQDFGKLDGMLTTNATVNLQSEEVEFLFNSRNTKFNYEPFSIDIAAAGNFDSLRTTRFAINDEIFLDAWMQQSDSLDYGVNLQAVKININEYLKYVMNSYSANQIKGQIDFNLDFDSRKQETILGKVNLNDFAYDTNHPINGNLLFSGDLQKLNLDNAEIYQADNKFFNLTGNVKILPELDIDLIGELSDFDLSEIIPESPLKGKLFAELSYKKNNSKSLTHATITGDNISISKQPVNQFKLDITQSDSTLIVHQLLAKTKDKLELTGSGIIDYNFLSGTAYPDSNKFNLNFQGDLFSILSEEIPYITQGFSSTSLNLELGIAENGFTISNGNLNISQAELKLVDQLKVIDKVKVDLNFIDNKMDIVDFKFRLGEGKIYLDNEISDEDNFELGTVNLGKFKIHTSNSGLLVHMPGYMPSNAIANVNITGRDSEDLLVSGPFDDMKIVGNIKLSNGEAIFPPDTENLMKLFTSVRNNNQTKEKSYLETEPQDLPFTLDVIIDIDENIRYVTYPANLNISSDSFLHMKYEDGIFLISEALFICEDGIADIFGTQMQTDYLEIQLNEYQKDIQIIGNFYKQASDGTMITFEIYDASTGMESTNLQFQLVSDDSSDGILDILSLLRYGRRVDDIGEAQKKTLLQDEVVSIIGVGLESALLDPLISPIENWIRSTIKLDFFYLSTELVQNVVSNFTNNSDDQQYLVSQETDESISSLNYDDFLNNFSVHAGKYLSRKLFFDYEVTLENSYDLEYNKNLGVSQFYTLRYDLPWDFRLVYQYEVQPYSDDTHELTLQKSFRF